jgi:hypothetical protein
MEPFSSFDEKLKELESLIKEPLEAIDLFVKDGENYSRCGENFNEVAYTNEELTASIEKAGFKVLSRFAESTFLPPEQTTQRVTYVVSKNK